MFLQQSLFKDVSVLGNFLDNHDNARFLNGNSQYTILYNALTYVLFAQVTIHLLIILHCCHGNN